MIIEFQSADRMLAIRALGIYDKALDAAVTACEKVYAPTLYLAGEKSQAERASEWIGKALDEMGAGETREPDMPAPLALTLRTAASIYLGQLYKLAEKQGDLLVPLDETQEVVSHVQSLYDRLSGQTELASVIDDALSGATVSVNGGASMPFNTPTERKAAAETIAHELFADPSRVSLPGDRQ